jgi:hypothetical protein
LVLGSIGVLVLFVVAAILLQLRRKRHQPIDMAAIQDEILAGLNLGGTSFNFGKDELGLTLVFTKPLALAGARPVPMAASHCGQQLLYSLQSLERLPNRLALMLKDQDTTITVDMHSGAALLTMKRPLNHTLKPGAEDKFATLLQRRAAAKEIHIKKRHFVQDVSVAVPKRVPHELNRRSILRLNVLVCSLFPRSFIPRVDRALHLLSRL